MHIGIVAQQDNPRAAELADRLRQGVEATVSVDESTAEALELPGTAVGDLEACGFVVSIGGDGTFLFTARKVTPTPVLGVNLGEVGFLNVVSPEEALETVRRVTDRFRRGETEFQELPQIRATGDGWSLPPALNEVAVLGPQRGRNNGVGVEISVDGELSPGPTPTAPWCRRRRGRQRTTSARAGRWSTPTCRRSSSRRCVPVGGCRRCRYRPTPN